jgi:subtilisin family serine protease
VDRARAFPPGRRWQRHATATPTPPARSGGGGQDATPLPPLEQPGQPGHGVTVALLDSGFDSANTWFGGRVTGDPEQPVTDGYGRLLPYSGHGTFVAGVVVRHAPGARVIVKRVFNDDGIVDDWTAARALADAADAEVPVHVVNMSIGAYARRDRGLLACDRAIGYAKFRRPEMVLVAAAGNEQDDRPCSPAANKRVLAVAAVEHPTAGAVPDSATTAGGWTPAPPGWTSKAASSPTRARWLRTTSTTPTRRSTSRTTCTRSGIARFSTPTSSL